MSAPPPGRLRAYLELCRVSNLPTCWSNVLVGVAIGAHGGGAIAWGDATLAALAVSLLYVGGMALNDTVDARIDAAERPGRPVPSGRISRRRAGAFAAACLGAGTLLTWPLGTPALLVGLCLLATIVAYDLVHKHTALSVLLMGACRGLTYLLAAAAAWPIDTSLAAWLCGAISLYIVLLTLTARAETGNRLDARRFGSLLLPVLALAPLPFVLPGAPGPWVLLTGALLVGWLLGASRHVLRRPPSVRRAVLAWLAGICLLDALYLAALDRPTLVPVALACFAVTAVGHRHILGT